jgi:hypothetical protein
MTQRFGAIAALTFAAIAFAPPANATERTYPGLRCVSDNGSPPCYGEGKASNCAAGRARFVCPINRNALDGGTFTGASVWVEVRSGERLSCSLVSCPSDGSSCSKSNDVSTGSDGVHKLALGSAVKYLDGYAYVLCDVPGRFDGSRPASGVISYRWDE